MFRKLGLRMGLLFLVAAGVLSYLIWGENVKLEIQTTDLYIPSNTSFNELYAQLKEREILRFPFGFLIVAKLMKYDKQNLKCGKYHIEPSWSNRALIKHLRSGEQSPVNVTINSARTVVDLSEQFAKNLELDSLAFSKALTNEETAKSYGFSQETFMCMFIPNTYKMFWDSSVKNCLDRFKFEHDKFWKANNRTQKAIEKGLEPEEVYTLASIVEKETNLGSEKRRMAGMYLNRLDQGILLQADPTVVFANGDFTLRRVLNIHLEKDSPYNTYKYAGLPPGPICMPSIESIDAVLNAEKNDYIFMCAKPGYGNAHAFAQDLSAHNQNARVYREWLKSEGIR